MIHSMKCVMALAGATVLGACSGAGGEVVSTSTDDLGKTKYHYEPTVEDVTFNAGCGVVTTQQTDCSYGFEMKYQKDYVDLTTTVTHTTSESSHTIDVTVDTWSHSKVHPMVVVGPQIDDLGVLGAKAGETYEVRVYDRDHVKLWSGKVATTFHM